MESVTDALSPNLGATLDLTSPNASGIRFLDLTIPGALDSNINQMKIISYGFVAQQPTSYSNIVSDSLLTEMKAGAGTFRIGNDIDFLGPLSGTNPTRVEILVRSVDGWGPVRDLWSFVFPPQEDLIPLEVTDNPVLEIPTEGEPLVITGPVFTSEAGVTFTYVYKVAENTSGLNEELITDPGGVCPNIDGALDTLFVGAYFAGPGITGDGVGSGLAGPYWSDGQTITPAGVETPVDIDDLPLLATNLVRIDGIVDDSFVAGDTLTAGAATATIVAFVPETSELFLGPITNGPITDNTALTSTSGGDADANGASQSWAPAGGEPFYILDPTWTGTPTQITIIQHIRDNSDDVTPTEIDLSGSFPEHYGTKQYRKTWRVSGYGIVDYEDFDTGWIDINVPTLDPLETTDWIIHVVEESEGVERVDEVYIRDSLSVSEARWTTSTASQIQANPFPIGHEPMTAGSTIEVEGTTYRRWATADAIYGTPSKNFVLFSSSDEARRTRFGVVVQIGGAWSPLGERQTVPKIDVADPEFGSFQRFLFRSQVQSEQAEPGGSCLQFPRGVAADGDWMMMSFDVTWPNISENYGTDWVSDPGYGLNASQTTSGLCIVDTKYVLGMFGPLFMDGNDGQPSTYDTKGGIYRYNRQTKVWTHVQSLTDVFGSNAGSMRINQKYVAWAEGTGTTTENRTCFAVYAPSDGADSFGNYQIYKSTDSGATWSADGAAQSTATHGVPIEIWADSDRLYLATKTKLRTRPIGSTTWSDATGLATGHKLHVELRGTQIYCGVKGQGIYQATKAAAPSFTRIKQYNLLYFSVSPADTDRQIVVGPSDNDTNYPLGTHDGWTTQFRVVSNPFPGQPENFEHKLANNPQWQRWHDTDPNIIFGMAFQHTVKSINGGRTFNWSSRNMDYSETRHIAVHPTDYKTFFAGMTDKLTIVFPQGMAFSSADNLEGSDKDVIDGFLGSNLSAYTATGALILSRDANSGNSWDRKDVFIAHCGNNISTKVPVVFERGSSQKNSGTGNGTLTYTVSDALPGGTYKLICTTGGGNGVGIFNCVNPVGISLGSVTVGTQTTLSDPRGGRLVVTINDGSTDHAAGLNPKIFEIFVDPLSDHTIQNPSTKDAGFFGQHNPAEPARGITGRHVYEMYNYTVNVDNVTNSDFEEGDIITAGSVTARVVDFASNVLYLGPFITGSSISDNTPITNNDGAGSCLANGAATSITTGLVRNTRFIAYPFFGYMGSSGEVILGHSGNQTLMRSVNEGRNWTTWCTNAGHFSPKGTPIITASSHDDQRAYTGTNTGQVKRIQNGIATEIFSYAKFCNANGITPTNPGKSVTVNGISYLVPGCTGVVESWYDPNLLYAVFYVFGEPLCFFRTENALDTTPTWYNISSEGLVGYGTIPADIKGVGLIGPLQGCSINRHTDEVFLRSSHGTVVFKPKASHLSFYNITDSLIDDLRAMPGSEYFKSVPV